MTLQHLRSSTANKRPTPAAMSDGQLAMNTNLASPGLFLKDSNGDLVKIGPVHVGTTAPNATPAVGGQAGNSVGEQWLDTTGGVYVFKIYDGTAWRSETGTFVDVNGDTMTGALGIIAGSAAAPGVFFSGDTNTGIYSPGADQVAVATNGTGRLFVDASGRVGIGTGSPGYSLHVTSAATTDIFIGTGSDDSRLYFTDANRSIRGVAGGDLAAYTLGTERLRISSAGLVGIGTSSPSEALHIASGGARISSSLIGGGASSLGLDYESSNARFISYGPDVSTQTGLIFLTGNSTASTTIERLRITAAGNVGIGTTSPQASLGFGTSIDTTPTDVSKIQLYNSGGAIYGFGVSTNQLNYRAGTAGDAHVWYSGFAERARIDSSGRLLVGTSTARSIATQSLAIQNEGTSFGTTGFSTCRNSNDIYGPYIHFGKTRGASVGSNTLVSSGDDLGGLIFGGGDGTDVDSQAAYILCQVDGTPGANDMPGRLVFSTTADGASLPTERMRIDALGALKTSPNGTYKFSAGTTEITHNDATSTVQLTASSTGFTGDAVTISTFRNTVNDSYKFLSCIRQGFAVALEIRDDGDVYNVNGTYGSLSDVKLKENIVDANSQWDDIRQLRVRNYNFKPETNNSTHKQIGVIAQEIEDISPGLVNTVPDRDEDGNDLGTVTKSVNYSVLYMKAVKALQEAMERIETLEARLTVAGIE